MDPAVPLWKEQFVFHLQHLVVANCRIAVERLAAARPFVEAPIFMAVAAAERANIDLTLPALASAHDHLHLVAANMLALECLGLAGGRANPAAPLPAVQDLVGANAPVGAALARLRVACERADSGCDYIDRCRGVLKVIYYLLDHHGLPHVDDLVGLEHAHATAAFNHAAQMLQSFADEAAAALHGMAGPG